MLMNLLRAAKVKSPEMMMPPAIIEPRMMAILPALNKFINMKSNKIYLY